jgi:hypothetical protein
MANISRTSRASKGKRLKKLNDLCEAFGLGVPIFTYLEKTLYKPFQVGETVEELGISSNIF